MRSNLFAKAVAALATATCFFGPLSAQEYSWPQPVPAALIAPTDTISTSVSGALLQGGLVDLRYGQACLLVAGQGIVLNWSEQSHFTLDGKLTEPKILTDLVADATGLVALVRYDPESGQIGWLDAVSNQPMSAIAVTLSPDRGPALESGGELTIFIGQAESERLQLSSAHLFAPGMTHQTAFRKTDKGLKASLPLMAGWEIRDIPMFVITADQRVLRARSISVTSHPPVITHSGPSVASLETSPIRGWIDWRGPEYLLDPISSKISVSRGAILSDIRYAPGRINFLLSAELPGEYQVQATIVDQLGRSSETSWSLQIRN